MGTIKYKIEYLPSFEEEFDEILYYIVWRLKNKKAAERLLNQVEYSIKDRSSNPESFEVYRYAEGKYTWYRIYVDNYTIFYTVKDNKMMVTHIFYSMRNFDELF